MVHGEGKLGGRILSCLKKGQPENVFEQYDWESAAGGPLGEHSTVRDSL